jgi:O-antigen/teichoic acid export membrane protein
MGHGARIFRALGSAWLLLAVLTVAQLAQISIALRLLPAEEFGLFSVLSQLLGNLMLIEMGVAVAVGRMLIDARIAGAERLRTLWSSSIGIFAIQGGIVLLAVLGCMPLVPMMFDIPAHLHSEARWVFLAIGINGVAGYLSRPWALALFATQRVAQSNLIQATAIVVQFCTFAGCAFGGLRIWSLVIGNVVTTLFTIGAVFIAARRCDTAPTFDRAALDWSEMRRVLKLALDLFTFGFFNTFIQNSLLVLAGWQKMPLTVIAALTVNAKLLQLSTQLLHRIPASAESFMMDILGRGDMGRFRFGWLITARTALAAATCLAGGLYLFAAPFIRWWVGPAMILPGAALVWLTLLPVRHIVHHVFVSSLVMFKEIHSVRWAMLRELAVYIGLAFALTPRFGLTGLIAANLLSIIPGAVWQGARRFSALSGVAIAELSGTVLRTLLPGAVTLAVLLTVVPNPERMELSSLMLVGVLWVAIHAAAFWVLILERQQRLHLTGLFRRVFAR